MPNWCYNSVVFSGDKESISKIKKDLTQPVFLLPGEQSGWLANINPEPPPWGIYWSEEEKAENSAFKPYERVCARTLTNLGLDYNSIGYDEMISEAVGCKWDFNVDIVEETEDHLSYRFDSPWGPPQIWVSRVALKYKLHVELEFEESGDGIAGKFLADGAEGVGTLIESSYDQKRFVELGGLEQWLEHCREGGDTEEELEQIREEAKDWPTTESEYDVRFCTGEFELVWFIPSSE